MSDISEYEGRISAALERISRLAEGGMGSGEQITALEQALSDEKTTSAQLEHRISSLNVRVKSAEDGSSEEISGLKGSLAALDGELQKLRAANDQLRDLNGQLREANAQGVGDAHLINRALQTELEAVKARQAADRAEVDAILAELCPLMGEG